jgi:hypothetical protein
MAFEGRPTLPFFRTKRAAGWLWCETLGYWLGTWQGIIDRETAIWARFYDPEGNLIPLPEEAAQETSGRGTGAIKCYSASSGSGKTAFSTAGGWFAGNGRDFISNVGVKTVRRQT